MMDRDALPCKVGDRAWFATTESVTPCTVLGFNPPQGMVWTASVRADDGREFVCSINQIHAGIEPPALIPRYPPLLVSKQWRQPESLQLEPEPEPVCEPSQISEESLTKAIASWEYAVNDFEKFPDDDSEYDQDLTRREHLHGVLNGFKQASLVIPPELQKRLDAADQQFMAVTQPDCGVWHDSQRYDPIVFWYYFRWLKIRSDPSQSTQNE